MGPTALEASAAVEPAAVVEPTAEPVGSPAPRLHQLPLSRRGLRSTSFRMVAVTVLPTEHHPFPAKKS